MADRSAPSFNGDTPVYENETGSRTSFGETETVTTQAAPDQTLDTILYVAVNI